MSHLKLDRGEIDGEVRHDVPQLGDVSAHHAAVDVLQHRGVQRVGVLLVQLADGDLQGGARTLLFRRNHRCGGHAARSEVKLTEMLGISEH